MATIVQIADAVVEALNGHEFSRDVTAARSYLPRYTLSDLETTRLSVIPRGRTTEIDTRGSCQRRLVIEVAIHAKMDAHDSADEIDPLVEFAEEVEQFVIAMGAEGATCIEIYPVIEDDGTYDVENLAEVGVFVCAFSAVFLEVA